jgi:hypothetical protein
MRRTNQNKILQVGGNTIPDDTIVERSVVSKARTFAYIFW